MGREWTNNSNTPFRYFKVTVGEGGVRSPFVISGPELSKKIVQNTPAHVMDIAPTIFDLADIIPAEQDIYDGKLMPRGQSLLSVFNGDNVDANRTIVTELFGSRMVRRGNWKAMLQNKPLGSGEWELFDIVKDPSATNNLASTHPELLTELRAAYDAFAKENNLIAPETRLNPQLITLYEGPCDGWCEAKFTLAQTLIDPVKRTILIVGLLGVVVLIGALIIRRRRRRLRSQ